VVVVDLEILDDVDDITAKNIKDNKIYSYKMNKREFFKNTGNENDFINDNTAKDEVAEVILYKIIFITGVLEKFSFIHFI
jgi:hypothetical protein